MEARLAASLQEARDKESTARADADKFAQEAKTLRADVTALKASLGEKERALEEAHKRSEALKQRAESAELEAAGFRQRKDSAEQRNAAALADARVVREQAEVHERAAREAARRIEVAERKAEERAQVRRLKAGGLWSFVLGYPLDTAVQTIRTLSACDCLSEAKAKA